MTRLGVAAGLAESIAKSLDELERQLALRTETDADPLGLYLAGDEEFGRVPDTSPVRQRAGHRLYRAFVARRVSDRDPLAEWVSGDGGRLRRSAKEAVRRSWSLTAKRARLAAAPVALAVALSTFALVRLPSANTLWYEELTITADVTTLESFCEPPDLTFVESVTTGGQTTLVYALSGDGDGVGPGCLPKDISNIFIEVCFNPELTSEDDKGRVEGTTEPPGWEYSPKASGDPKRVKWDWESAGPNKGPWDPELDLFSFTLDVEVDSFETSNAYYKAGPDTVKLGEVQVPACPLPDTPETEKKSFDVIPIAEIDGEPEGEPETEEEVEPEPEEAAEEPVGEYRPGGAIFVSPEQGTNPPKPTPTPKPTPVAISRPAAR